MLIACSCRCEGRALIAVGANHLYGEGMLALIEKQRYRLERVY